VPEERAKASIPAPANAATNVQANNLERRPQEARNPTFAPANDDRLKNGAPTYRRAAERPSRALFFSTTALSAAWLAGGAALTNALHGPAVWQASSYPEILSNPSVITLLAGTVLPVGLFFAFTALIRRAQEMRVAAQSISDVA